MKRFLLIASISCLFLLSANANSFDKVVNIRNSIQKRLNLSAAQEAMRKEINTNFYREIEPKFNEIDICVNKIANIANGSDITKEKIDSVRKEFESTESELSEINQKYEKEFRSILNPYQKVKYSIYKKQARMKLKKELKEEVRKIGSK